MLEHEQITAEEIDYLLEHRHLKRDEVKSAPVEEVVQPEPQAEQPESEKAPEVPDESKGE